MSDLPIESGKELFSLIMASEAQDVPDGWKTARQWSDVWGVSESQTYRAINKGMKNLKLEKKEFKIRTSNGVRFVPHYKPCE